MKNNIGQNQVREIKLYKSRYGASFLITLLALCFLYILPIILADRMYGDDILRSQQGYTNWDINGRPLADLMMKGLFLFGDNIADISPLPLILGVILFSASSLYYARTNLSEFSPYTSAVIMFFIIANPFFLENLSYKFDSLPMLVSVAVLFIPFFHFKSGVSWFAASVSAILVSLCIYQASIGFFVALSIIEFMRGVFVSNASKFSELKRASLRLTQLLIAYAIYSPISKHYVWGSYNIKHSEIVGFNKEGIVDAANNAVMYLGKISLMASQAKWIVCAVLVAVVFYTLRITITSIKNNGYSAFFNAFIITFSPVILLFVSFAHLSLLKYPVTDNRVLVSFSGVMLFAAISSMSISKSKQTLPVIAFILCLFPFVFSFSYGSALKYQAEYDKVLSSELAREISIIDPDAKAKVFILGTQPSSVQRANIIKRFPAIETLVPLYYSGGWWGTFMIHMYGVKNEFTGTKDLDQVCDMKLRYRNQTFSLFSLENKIVVSFIREKC
ncbi:glucosyltransferase domain-containing protein [Enterobacter kobei]|uniref:glucosyltransferase domain-containing protein n=1 Tax=Enterobacter kobei TaxID=208224 RepID=UPI001BE0D762|nr:glucosyltransferase domain-containing protein [Enterobacter kobei]MBT1800745.1 glucosyltransferase domain-containing protein [Enterobacter kobei]